MERFFSAIVNILVVKDMIWFTIITVFFVVCIAYSIYKGIVALIRFIKKQLNKPVISEEDLSDANQRADKWYSFYLQSCRALETAEQELEATKQELAATEDELFDLQQAHSELGTAYNELKDLLIENGIDPDLPQY